MTRICRIMLFVIVLGLFGCSGGGKEKSEQRSDTMGGEPLFSQQPSTSVESGANPPSATPAATKTLSSTARSNDTSAGLRYPLPGNISQYVVTPSPRPSPTPVPVPATNREISGNSGTGPVKYSPSPKLTPSPKPTPSLKPPSSPKPSPKAEVRHEIHDDYELILPADASANKSYFLLLCLHPSGDAREYVNYLKPLAKGNWIIAASTKYANGVSIYDFIPPVEAAVADIKRRHNISKVFMGGFSGGGMASYVSAYVKPGAYDGVISNDGLLHPSLSEPEYLKTMRLPKAVILSGTTDTVVPPKALQENKRQLDNVGVRTHFITFTGGHQFAPLETYRAAMEWLVGSG